MWRRLNRWANGDVRRRIRRAARCLRIFFWTARARRSERSAAAPAHAVRTIGIASVAFVIVGRLKSPSHVFHVCFVREVEPTCWEMTINELKKLISNQFSIKQILPCACDCICCSDDKSGECGGPTTSSSLSSSSMW